MVLCYGSFAKVLTLCKPSTRNPSNKELQTKLLSAVCDAYVSIPVRDDLSNGLLKCKQGLNSEIISAARSIVEKAETDKIADYFEKRIINAKLIKSDSETITRLVAALLDMIRSDNKTDVEDDDELIEMVSGTRKKALLSQSCFTLPDFLAGLFLYVVLNGDNSRGRDCIKNIDGNWISKYSHSGITVLLTRNQNEKAAQLSASSMRPYSDKPSDVDLLHYSDIRLVKHIMSVLSKDTVRIIRYDKGLTPDYNPYTDIIEPLINFANWLYDGKNTAINVQLDEYRQFLGEEIREFAELSIHLYEKTPETEEYDDAYGEVSASMQAVRETYELLVRYCKERMPTEEIDKINDGIYADYDKYLTKVKEMYGTKKTYLHGEQEREFYSFYVINDIARKDGYSEDWVSIGVPSAETVTKVSKHIIISGTGGLGKSMMMLHLLFSAIADHDRLCLLPVFLELKNFTANVKTIADFIVAEVRCFDKGLSKEKIIERLENGSCLLLFDGWDEVAKPQIERFENELHNFAKEYSECSFILSTRPFKSFTSFRFTELHLQPLSKGQAIKLIKKLKYRPNTPDISKNFIEVLGNGLFEKHEKFAGNPLLLMIMLRTYARTGRVPDNLYQFYEEAYNTLAAEHDASKGYIRQLRTGLSKERFAEIFAEVCYLSYKDGDYDFSESDFKRYLSRVKLPKNFDNGNDFLFDTRANLCLMFLEGGEYRFMHRTFQEYFCALSLNRKLTVFSSTDSEKRKKFVKQLIDFFEEHSSNSDNVLPMLYEMLPEKVEEYVFIPFLEDMFNKYDSSGGNPYINYLFDMYENIHYTNGEVRSKADNDPLSNLYQFIIGLVDFKAQIGFDRLPFHQKFVTEAFDENGSFCPKSFTEEDYAEGYGPVESTGYYLEVSFDYIFRNPKKYEDFIETLTDDEFVLKKEYHAVRKFLVEMKSRQTITDDDILNEI